MIYFRLQLRLHFSPYFGSGSSSGPMLPPKKWKTFWFNNIQTVLPKKYFSLLVENSFFFIDPGILKTDDIIVKYLSKR